MNTRVLFSATILASSLALLPQAHAEGGLWSSVTSANNKLQSQVDRLNQASLDHQKKLDELQTKYQNASAQQRAKIQKRMDKLNSRVASEKEKLGAQKEKLTNMKKKLENAPDKIRQDIKQRGEDWKKNANARAEQRKENLRNKGKNAVGNAIDKATNW